MYAIIAFSNKQKLILKRSIVMDLNSHNNLRKAFNHVSSDRSIHKLDDYYFVVNGEALKDFTSRTIKGIKKEDTEEARKWLADKIYNYINNIEDDFFKSIENQDDFDDWHKKICCEFCRIVKEKSGLVIMAGKAQKILNMTLKYVFCFEDADTALNKFEYCHMALDHYTLELWFGHVVKPWYNDQKSKDLTNGIEIINGMIASWSNLAYDNEAKSKKDKLSYIAIQKIIREYLKQQSDLTPFQKEFYIWKEEQLKEWLSAGISILGKNNEFDLFPSYHMESICKDCDKVIKNIEIIKNKFCV